MEQDREKTSVVWGEPMIRTGRPHGAHREERHAPGIEGGRVVTCTRELGASSASTALARPRGHLRGHEPEGFGFSVCASQGSLHTEKSSRRLSTAVWAPWCWGATRCNFNFQNIGAFNTNSEAALLEKMAMNLCLPESRS